MKNFLLIILLITGGLSFGQSAGDIAFVGFNADGDKAFSIVALTDLDGSVTPLDIYFTDDNWNGTAFAGSEGIATWTVSSLISAGTVVDFTDVSGAESVSVGSVVVSGALNPAGTNEAIYAYVGTSGTPTAFLAAITNDDFAASSGDLTGTGLTLSTHALELDAVDPDADVAEYIGTRIGTQAELLTEINDATNWITQDASLDQSTDGIEPDVPFNNKSFIIPSGTTITWDGSEEDGDWSNANNWDSGTVPTSADNVVIADVSFNPTIGPFISEDFAVNNLTINTGGNLTVTSGSSLAIFGTVTNNGTYSVARDSEGNGGYSIMSSPVVNETIGDLIDTDFAYSFDGASFSSNLTGTATTMNPGQGYFIGSNDASPNMTFSGTPNSGTITYSVTSGNFELVGNPYSAAISVSDFLIANSAVINGAVYFWDDGGSNSATSGKRGGDYITTNGMGTASAVEPDGVTDDVTGSQGTGGAINGYITSTQGVFVQATATGDVSFTPSMQETIAGANVDGNHYRQEEIEYQKLKLAISGNGLYNEILVGLGSDATFGRDAHLDAMKLVSENSLSFYSLMGEDKYVIQGLPLVTSKRIQVQLGFDLAEAGNYKLEVVNKDNIPVHLQVILRDNLTGQTYDLKHIESLDFSTSSVQNDQRFELQFVPSRILSHDDLSQGFKLVGNSSELTIQSNFNGEEAIAIHTLDGKVVFQKDVSFQDNQVTIQPALNQNTTYILRVGEQSFKFVIQ